MADNLSIQVTADTSSLQAQLALARAEVTAYGAEVRRVASDINSGNIGRLGELEQVAGNLAGARAEVAALSTQIKDHTKVIDEHRTALGGLKEAGVEAAGGIKEVGSSLLAIAGLGGGLGALAGLFAVEGLVEFVKTTAEAAERTENLSAALGIAPSKFALLSAEMKLVGGDSELAVRGLLALETKLTEAAGNPASHAREAFLAMNISVEEMKAGLNDLPGFLARVSEAWRNMPAGPERTDTFSQVFSRRGLANIVPFLEHDPAELEASVKGALGGQLPTDESIKKLAEYAQQINTLGVAFDGLKKAIVAGFIDPLTDATRAATAWVSNTKQAITDLREIVGVASTIGGIGIGATVGAKVGGVPGAIIGGTVGGVAGVEGIGHAIGYVKDQLSQIGAYWQSFAKGWDDLQQAAGHGRPSGTVGGLDRSGTTEDVLRDHGFEGAAGSGVGFGSRDAREGHDRAAASVDGLGKAAAAASEALGLEGQHAGTKINEYLNSGGVNLSSEDAAWCAAFANAALARQGIKGTGSNIATSFDTFGSAVNPSDARRGDIIVLDRGHKTGETGGHVGFATGESRERNGQLELEMVAGNENHAVGREFVRADEARVRRATETTPEADAAAATSEAATRRRVDDAKEAKDQAKEIKDVGEALKLETAQYDLQIQAAKGQEPEIQRLAGLKIDAAQRAASAEQAIREKYAGRAEARGNQELADQYRSGGGTSLEVKDLAFQKEKLALQQRFDEETARSAVAQLETQRRVDTQIETTDLQAVERRRQLGDITAGEAADEEIRIVQQHLAATEQILADEAQKAEGIKKLADEVANRKIEAESKAAEQIKRIQDKAAQEEEQRAHAIDRELAGTLASGAVGVATGRQTPLQAIGGFAEGQATKALGFVGEKALDATGIGKLLSGAGDKIGSLFGATAKTSGESALGAAATTAAGQVTGFGGALAGVTATLTGHGAAVGVDTAATGASTAATTVDTAATGVNTAATGISTAATGVDTTARGVNTLTTGVNTAVTGLNSVATEVNSAAQSGGGIGSVIGAVASVAAIALWGGGIIPSAAGGMVNDGKGGRLIIGHPDEMVLPRDLSLGIQDMIHRGSGGGWTVPRAPTPWSLAPNLGAGGAAAGGGAGPVNISVNAIDSRDVARFFRDNQHLVAQAVSGARRNFSPAAI